jgi:transcriptional regulator with XRE-family HTH domain
MAETSKAIQVAFGGQVRALRAARRLTAAALAARCDVSRSLISQIETGRIGPSLDVVRRLAAALEVPIGALFTAEDGRGAPAGTPPGTSAVTAPGAAAAVNGNGSLQPAQPSAAATREPRATLVRRDERKGLRLPRSKLTYELLSPDLRGQLQVQWVELAPGETGPADGFVHPGEECYVVLEGTIRFRVGDREFVLHPGDALAPPTTVPPPPSPSPP